MKRRRPFQKLLFLLLLAASIWAANRFFGAEISNWIKHLFASPTPRAVFMKKAKKEGKFTAFLLNEWDSIYQIAKQEIISIDLRCYHWIIRF
ncbi:MAG: hypothetical protein AAFO82_07955 [Bacteroidota bacterium]